MISLDRNTFFALVRDDPFPRQLRISQVSGINDLLDAWEERGTDDPRHLAYALATSYHETGRRMQPVREAFAASDAEARRILQRHFAHKDRSWYCWPAGPHGHVYYGRGDVQLTWHDNYERMGRLLDLPLAEHPDLALESPISKVILIEGLLRGASGRGDFTGRSLEQFFNRDTDDPVNARRVVNGLDRAEDIAGYHRAFLRAIRAAMDSSHGPTIPFQVNYTSKDDSKGPGMNAAVRHLQEKMKAAGKPVGRIDGILGPKTAGAVRSYLADQDLRFDVAVEDGKLVLRGPRGA